MGKKWKGNQKPTEKPAEKPAEPEVVIHETAHGNSALSSQVVKKD